MARRPKQSANKLGTQKDTFILSSSVQTAIISRVRELVDNRSSLDARRSRFVTVDRAILLEDLKRKEQDKKHEFVNDHRPPTLLAHVDTAYSFYVNLFAAGEPVFKVVGSVDNMDAVNQMQAKVNSDADRYAYTTNLCKAIRDCIKYDEMTMLLEWDSETLPALTASNNDGSAVTEEQILDGNKLLHVSPYNTFYDESVEHIDRHYTGTHTGYFERVSLVQLHQRVSSWIDVGKSVMNVMSAFTTGGVGECNYYKPNFDDDKSANDTNGLATLWGLNDAPEVTVRDKYQDFKEQYEVCTVYMRLIPSMYGIQCSDPGRVQIFKFVIVNMATLVLAERVTNALQCFPLITAQMNDENIAGVSKSMGELLMPAQNLETQLVDTALALLYKAAGDKGIYDSKIISRFDIESRKPNAKIPAKPSATGRSLREAYVPLPFDASAINIVATLRGIVQQDAQEITGQNNASRGQFQKGNRTLQEYQDVMSNAESLKYTKALLIENSFFTPIKSLIRNNILQYMKAGTIKVNGQEIEVSPVDLRAAALSFRIADGLKNVERIANTGALGEAMQLLMQQGQLAVSQGYDPFKALLQYLTYRGVDLSELKAAAPNANAAIPANSVAGAEAMAQQAVTQPAGSAQ